MKTTVIAQRISNITLLKLLLLGGIISWTLFMLGLFIYLLAAGGLQLPYEINGVEEITSLTSGVKFFAMYTVSGVFLGFIFIIGFWLELVIGLWLYSKLRPIAISYYESDADT
jgi:hypothetical protein